MLPKKELGTELEVKFRASETVQDEDGGQVCPDQDSCGPAAAALTIPGQMTWPQACLWQGQKLQ